MYRQQAPICKAQPAQMTLVDGAQPICQGLVFAGYTLPNGIFFDAITGQFARPPSSTGSTRCKAGLDGNRVPATSLIFASDANASAQFPNQTGWDLITGNKFSIFLEGSLEINASQNPHVVHSFSSSTGNGFGFGFDDTALFTNSTRAFIENNGSDGGGTDILGTNSEQFTHRICFTSDGTNHKHYAKNKLAATTADATSVVAHSTRRVTLSGTGSAQQGGSVSCCFVWNRPLTLVEYQTLYDNPWQVFAQRRTIWTDVGSAAPPPTGNWYNSLATTGCGR